MVTEAIYISFGGSGKVLKIVPDFFFGVYVPFGEISSRFVPWLPVGHE